MSNDSGSGSGSNSKTFTAKFPLLYTQLLLIVLKVCGWLLLSWWVVVIPALIYCGVLFILLVSAVITFVRGRRHARERMLLNLAGLRPFPANRAAYRAFHNA